jgi:hypothetical protein
VDVLRGQVEVADFKSGQYALVLPGQVAKIVAQGLGGLSLSGSGTLSPIKKGEPRAPSVQLLPVTEAARTAPSEAPRAQAPQAQAPQAQQMASAAPASAPLAAAPAQPSSGPSLSIPVQKNESGLPHAYNSSPGHKNETGLPIPSHASAPADAPSLWRPTRMAADDSAGRSSGKSFGFSAWGGGASTSSDRPRNRREDITFDLALSAAIGGFVAFAVGVPRFVRRRKQAPS